jgi:hypothetical protein
MSIFDFFSKGRKTKKEEPAAEVEAPQPARVHIDILPAAERDAILAEHLSPHLLPLGLSMVRPRIWVDVTSAPVKRMVQVFLWKACSITLGWGFSLDFVPHTSAGRHIRWHRTPKMAHMDINVELDKRLVYSSDGRLIYLSYLNGAARLHDELRRYVPEAVESARKIWERGGTESGLLDLLQEIREKRSHQPWSLRSSALAYAFLLARRGHLAAAEEALDSSFTEWDTEELRVKLKNLAREYARGSVTTGAKLP